MTTDPSSSAAASCTPGPDRIAPYNSVAPSLRVTYTKLAGLSPPQQGSVIRFNGVGQDGRLFRVVNAPEPDEDGTFTVELEPTDA